MPREPSDERRRRGAMRASFAAICAPWVTRRASSSGAVYTLAAAVFGGNGLGARRRSPSRWSST
jgi:hypothetical protein